MNTQTRTQRIYRGDGDELMASQSLDERLILIPDRMPTSKPDTAPHIRIMWGQHLLDDLLAGRYRSLVCAVNAEDNSHGIVSQLATLLPTSQWEGRSITAHARLFVSQEKVRVVKFDLDSVEMLALLRPASHEHLTLDDLEHGFRIVAEMIDRKPQRKPVASVSFLGARANRLLGEDGVEPSFETVLETMFNAGFSGDVYPAPWMWQCTSTPVYARYPFSHALEQMREGGF